MSNEIDKLLLKKLDKIGEDIEEIGKDIKEIRGNSLGCFPVVVVLLLTVIAYYLEEILKII